MTIRPRRALTAAAVASLLALSGCGGGGDDKASDPSSTPSASATSTSSGAPTDGQTDVSAADGDARSLSEVMRRTMSEGRSAHVTLDLGSQGSGQGDIRFDGSTPQMRLTMKVAGQDTEVRMVGGAVYVAVPGQGGKFMKMDTGSFGSALGMDPSQAIEELEKSGGAAKQVGEGHWRLSQDGATVDLYAGDDGYLQRIQADAAGTTMTMTYSDWGKDVEVEAPSKSDIVDAPTS